MTMELPKPQYALLFSHSLPLGIKVLYCLVMAGWKVSVAVNSRSQVLAWSRYASGTLKLPSFIGADPEPMAAEIDEYCRKKRISVILGDSIGAAGMLHQLQPYLRTPSYAPEPTQRLSEIHDKWMFYEALNSAVNLPRTALLRMRSDFDEKVVEQIGRPFVLKPLNAESAHGVVRFETRNDALAYLDVSGPYREFPLLIQQFIAGEDAGYCVIAENGYPIVEDTQYRDKDDVRAFCKDEQIIALGRTIIEKFNYSGPAFIDLRKERVTGKLYALECNCRFWNTITANARMGINYPDIAACMALGNPVHQRRILASTYHLPGTVARYFRSPGKLFQLSGRDWRSFFQAVTDPLPHLVDKYVRHS